MFKHLRGERSYVIFLKPKVVFLIIHIPHWLLARCRIRFLEKLGKVMEAKMRQLEATSTATPTPQAGKHYEFLSQITNTRMRIRNVRTYTYK